MLEDFLARAESAATRFLFLLGLGFRRVRIFRLGLLDEALCVQQTDLELASDIVDRELSGVIAFQDALHVSHATPTNTDRRCALGSHHRARTRLKLGRLRECGCDDDEHDRSNTP